MFHVFPFQPILDHLILSVRGQVVFAIDDLLPKPLKDAAHP